MTKHPDEIAAKAHLGLDSAGNVVERTAEAICDEKLVVCHSAVGPIQKNAPHIAPVKANVKPIQGRVNKTLNKLYDLEQSDKPDKPLSLDLDLYQMENY